MSVAVFSVRGPLEDKVSTVVLKDGSDLMMVEDEHGNQLGVNFKSDGTFEVGGWDAEGLWTPLSLVKPCDEPSCKVRSKHGRDFPLDQYTSDLLNVDV